MLAPSNFKATLGIFVAVCVSFPSFIYGGYGYPPSQEECCRHEQKPQYLPAPPGQRPPCAQPGQTFCAKVDNYPRHVINSILHKYGALYESFFLEEEEPKVGYGGYGYDTVPGGNSYHSHYNQSYHRQSHPPTNYYQPPPPPQQTFGPYVYRRARQLPFGQLQNVGEQEQQFSVDGASALLLGKEVHLYGYQNVALRTKRQSSNDPLFCPTNVDYVVPQAAQTKDGDWMFVVNMGETHPKIIQKVKTETCTRPQTECGSGCDFEPGSRSVCHQVMGQKRLVALDPNGGQFVGALFDFPSCCICRRV